MSITDSLRSLHLPSLGPQVSLEEIGERWRDALLVCAPEIIRRWLIQRDRSLIIAPQNGVADLYEAQAGDQQLIGDIDRLATGALQAKIAGAKGGPQRIVLRLPSAQVLKRTVAFPAQVRNNLAQVVRYEIDRLSPFAADQVYFDFRLNGSPAAPGKIAVDLALTRRAAVHDWLQPLRDAGAPVDTLTWDGAWPKANLLPVGERPQHRSSILSPTNLLLLLLLVLVTAALVTPLWQKQQQSASLTAQLQDVKAKAEKVFQTREALERARKGSVAVLQRKAEQPLVIDLLRELTQRLPDDTWVQNLDFQDGEVQLRGESAQATALIGVLVKTPGISDVAFRSPVVQVATTGRERFHISFQYRRPVHS
jgi:general secretion pathway protein L